jgi:hypothetical protein
MRGGRGSGFNGVTEGSDFPAPPRNREISDGSNSCFHVHQHPARSSGNCASEWACTGQDTAGRTARTAISDIFGHFLAGSKVIFLIMLSESLILRWCA